jgi:cytochrome c oxidase subunit 3
VEEAHAATRAAGRAGVLRPPAIAVGTIVWLSSEVMFFGALLAAAFTLRADAPGAWRPDGVHLDVPLAAVATAVLAASSWTQHRAASAAGRGDVAGCRRWVSVTIALGVAFVGAQIFEWSNLGFGIGSHGFGSAYYTLTGFHGLHVIGGVLALGVLRGRAAAAGFLVRGRAMVDVVTAYWHFVDAVWIAVFVTLYVVP